MPETFHQEAKRLWSKLNNLLGMNSHVNTDVEEEEEVDEEKEESQNVRMEKEATRARDFKRRNGGIMRRALGGEKLGFARPVLFH